MRTEDFPEFTTRAPRHRTCRVSDALAVGELHAKRLCTTGCTSFNGCHAAAGRSADCAAGNATGFRTFVARSVSTYWMSRKDEQEAVQLAAHDSSQLAQVAAGFTAGAQLAASKVAILRFLKNTCCTASCATSQRIVKKKKKLQERL